MRNAPNVRAERCRVRDGIMASDSNHGNNGAFEVPQKDGPTLRVMVGCGAGWDHVSVSLRNRCPTWDEMCLVKDLFFKDDEWVMQLHPAKTENISFHPYCLHLWRSQSPEERAAIANEMPDMGFGDIPTPTPIPIPPPWMVGPKR